VPCACFGTSRLLQWWYRLESWYIQCLSETHDGLAGLCVQYLCRLIAGWWQLTSRSSFITWNDSSHSWKDRFTGQYTGLRWNLLLETMMDFTLGVSLGEKTLVVWWDVKDTSPTVYMEINSWLLLQGYQNSLATILAPTCCILSKQRSTVLVSNGLDNLGGVLL